MPSFSEISKPRLLQAHPLLQQLMNAAIVNYDFTILCVHRGREAQEKAYRDGLSKAHYGQSPHNYEPALAVDVVPYPLDWKNKARFNEMSVVIFQHAKLLKIPIRWGGDWDNNPMTDDGWDMPHFELHPWRSYIPKGDAIVPRTD